MSDEKPGHAAGRLERAKNPDNFKNLWEHLLGRAAAAVFSKQETATRADLIAALKNEGSESALLAGAREEAIRRISG